MRIKYWRKDGDREKRRTRIETCPSVTLLTTDLTWGPTCDRTWVFAVTGRWLTYWDMARPFNYCYHCMFYWGTQWCSWLRHCATSRKVAGSIPGGVIGTFHWHNPSSRTMALASTQLQTEMGTRNISWCPVRSADNLTTFIYRLSWNVGASTYWNPQGLSWRVMGLLYLYVFY